MLSGERKKFALRSARKPVIVDGLSNTVIVYENGEPRFCHIMFDPCLATVVGKKLPRGVGVGDPAFLQIVFDAHKGKWIVAARYVKDWQGVDLWAMDELPSWIKELKPIRHNDYDNSTSHAQERTAATIDTARSIRIRRAYA